LSDLANTFQANKISLMYDESAFNNLRLFNFPGPSVSLGVVEPQDNQFTKVAFRYKNSDFYAASDGLGRSIGFTQPFVRQPLSPLRLFLLHGANDGRGFFSGCVRGIKFIPDDVSDLGIVELTK